MTARFPQDETVQRLLRADQLRQDGQDFACIAELRELAQCAGAADAPLLQEIGQRLTSLGLHVEAEDCFARSLASNSGCQRTSARWSTLHSCDDY